MFPSPASPESQTTHTHSAHPFSRSAPSPAACTRTGSPDRNTCTACMNAAQTRTSDISDPPASPPAPSRIARTATPRASPADSAVADPSHGPTSVGRSCVPRAASAVPVCAAHGRGPDSHAADILLPHTLPTTRAYCLPDTPSAASLSEVGTSIVTPASR